MANPYDLNKEANPPPPPTGFHVSGKRAIGEIVGVVVAIGLGVYLLYIAAAWLAGMALPLIPVEADVTVGEHSWPQLAPMEKRCTDPGPQAYVEQLAAPLIEALEDERFTFKFAVVDDPQINAFALPGGFVTVNFGLLEQAQSGEEIAAVLAHEIHHVTQRHGFGRILRQLSGAMAIGAVFGWLDLGSLTGAAVSLVASGYDRDQERESDTLGRALLINAHIDPNGMVAFFERLESKHGGGDLTALLTTHPGSAERAKTAADGPALIGPAIALPSPSGLRCRPDGEVID
jgi:predicted Zn-dependent protease